MPLIITPGHLSRLAEYYHQLGTMLTAGMTLVQALDQIQNSPPAGFLRLPTQRVLASLRQGYTFTEAMARLGKWLPSFDLALLKSGELGGRLDTSCKILAAYYNDRAQMARQVLSDLALPLFIVHAAIFLGAFPAFFLGGSLRQFLAQTLGVLAPFYLIFLVLTWACQSRRSATWRAIIERLLHYVPILGKARRHLALAGLARALEALLNAGVPIGEAWSIAAEASASPAIERAVRGFSARLQAGETPSELLRRRGEFPPMFTNLYATGEISGTLDDALKRLFEYYQDDAARKMKALAEWTPRVIYLIIVLVLALQIISFWTNYYQSILGQ